MRTNCRPIFLDKALSKRNFKDMKSNMKKIGAFNRTLICCFAFILAVAILLFPIFAAESWVKVPKEAKSREELIKTFGTSVGYGPVQRAEFAQFGRQIFAVWYDPYSGVAACYLHVYYYDPAKAEWIRFIDRYVHGQSDLSAELSVGSELIFRDVNGKVVIKESIAKLPVEKWYKEKKD